MTKRRSIIALFLAVAILALGVGYAALTDTLTIGGDINSPSFDPKVTFTAATVSVVDKGGSALVANTGTGATTAKISDDGDTITVHVGEGFDYSNGDNKDTITVDFTITNANGYAIKLGAITPATAVTNGTNFVVTCVYDTYTAGDEVDAGDTVDGTLTIVLNAVPAEGSALSDKFTFTIAADPVTATP